MSDAANLTGDRGESLFRLRVQHADAGRIALRAAFLGAKWPLFDALLLTERCGGPAFVSIRTTAGPIREGQPLPVRWTPRELAAMRAFGVPAYLAGVDLASERVYLLAANGGYDGSVGVLPAIHPLRAETAASLASEIDAFWDGRAAAFRSRFLPTPESAR